MSLEEERTADKGEFEYQGKKFHYRWTEFILQEEWMKMKQGLPNKHKEVLANYRRLYGTDIKT